MINSKVLSIFKELINHRKNAWIVFLLATNFILNNKSFKSRLFASIKRVQGETDKYEFAKFCLKTQKRFGINSVDYQDALILYLTKDKQCAEIFVEIGACDGVYKSNCNLLYRLGWKGLLVEANPLYAQALADSGKLFLIRAVTNLHLDQLELIYDPNKPSSGSTTNYDFYSDESLVKVLVPTIHVEDLCRLIKELYPYEVTYVSIDIEGREEEIIDRLLDYLNPVFVTIEHNNDPEKITKITEIYTSRNYHEIYKNLTRNEFILARV